MKPSHLILVACLIAVLFTGLLALYLLQHPDSSHNMKLTGSGGFVVILLFLAAATAHRRRHGTEENSSRKTNGKDSQ